MGKEDLKSGTRIPDGTVYAGVYPGTQQSIFTTPADADTQMIENAGEVIRKLNEENAYGHNDWRLPDNNERDTLLSAAKTGALQGTFNDTALQGFRLSGSMKLAVTKAHYLSKEDLNEAYIYLENREDGERLPVCTNDPRISVCIRPVRSGPV